MACPLRLDLDARDPPGDRHDGTGEGGRRLRTGREVGGAVQEQHGAPCELAGRFAGREPGREAGDRGDLRMTGGTQRGPPAHRMADEDDGHLAVGVEQLVDCPVGVADRIGVGQRSSLDSGTGGARRPRRAFVRAPRAYGRIRT